MNPKEFWLKKSYSNSLEKFDIKKLRRSLRKAGASTSICTRVIGKLEDNVRGDISTTKLHNLAHRYLRQESKILAANYRVKKAIEEIGPTGYPFEILCGELLKMKGFNVKVGLNVRGEFVNHEVDLFGQRKDMVVMAECKYHNSRSHKNDIKTALYVYARSLDIKRNKQSQDFDKFLLITNTYFSKDAIRYAKGVGLQLFAINSSGEDNFLDNIIKYRVYPITCLKSLKKRDAKILLEKKIVVIRQLKKNLELLEKFGLDFHEIKKIDKEINLLLQS